MGPEFLAELKESCWPKDRGKIMANYRQVQTQHTKLVNNEKKCGTRSNEVSHEAVRCL